VLENGVWKIIDPKTGKPMAPRSAAGVPAGKPTGGGAPDKKTADAAADAAAKGKGKCGGGIALKHGPNKGINIS
jgi:hypothetical protein